jgi:hypothetical protein
MTAPSLVAIPDSLAELAAAIDATHRAAIGNAKDALEHVRVCGLYLIAAKKRVAHGEWEDWLVGNTEVSIRLSQKYMAVARDPKTTRGSFSLNAALRAISDQRRAAFYVVDQPGLPLGDVVPDDRPLGWIIKPSDSWNFSRIHYRALTYDDTHGYLPGEILANCLWYWAEPGDVVVDPMAGSGMTWHVYQDRALWMPEPKDLDIRMFDLEPRGPYAALIGQHDLRAGFPTSRADYIILDPPYFGLVEGCYTERSGNIADFAEAEYRAAISAIARSCASVQKPGGRCTVITAASYTLLRTRTRLHVSLWFMEAFQAAGYEFHDRAFHSRRREAKGGPAIANLNRTAKERRFLTSDIIEILTFRLAGSSSGACRAT